MNSQNQSPTEMLMEARACLRRGDYASARVLAQALLARNPNDSEAINILLATDTKLHPSQQYEKGFLTRRSASNMECLLGGAIILVAGLCLIFSGFQAGWTGAIVGQTGRTTSGSTLILSGIVVSVFGGALLALGLTRFRWR